MASSFHAVVLPGEAKDVTTNYFSHTIVWHETLTTQEQKGYTTFDIFLSALGELLEQDISYEQSSETAATLLTISKVTNDLGQECYRMTFSTYQYEASVCITILPPEIFRLLQTKQSSTLGSRIVLDTHWAKFVEVLAPQTTNPSDSQDEIVTEKTDTAVSTVCSKLASSNIRIGTDVYLTQENDLDVAKKTAFSVLYNLLLIPDEEQEDKKSYYLFYEELPQQTDWNYYVIKSMSKKKEDSGLFICADDEDTISSLDSRLKIEVLFFPFLLSYLGHRSSRILSKEDLVLLWHELYKCHEDNKLHRSRLSAELVDCFAKNILVQLAKS